MFVTFLVSKLDKSSDVKRCVCANILPIFVTFPVLKLDISMLVNLLVCANIVDIQSTFLVSKLDKFPPTIVITVKARQPAVSLSVSCLAVRIRADWSDVFFQERFVRNGVRQPPSCSQRSIYAGCAAANPARSCDSGD